MGVDGPARPAGAVLDPRRLRHQPADDGRGLRHLRRARPALRPASGHPGPRLRRASSSRTSRRVRAGHARRHRRRGQRHPARRDGAGGFGAEHRDRQAVGRQDRHQPAATCPCGSSATPRARHRRDGRRRQRVRPLGQPQRPDRRRHLHQRGLRLDRRRPDLGRRDGRGLRQARLRGLPGAGRRRDRRRADAPSPTSRGLSVEAATAAARGGRASPSPTAARSTPRSPPAPSSTPRPPAAPS